MKANLKCTKCGYIERIEIPSNKCLQFYKCKRCDYLMSAKSCCVICDYSDKKCKKPI